MNEKSRVVSETGVQEEQSLKTITTVVYALQAASFFIGFSFIAAVIVNYIKLPQVADTWLESHFRWQIRTFWFSVLWSIIGSVLVLVLIGYLVLAAVFLWVIYRIARGWINLSQGKAMYQD